MFTYTYYIISEKRPHISHRATEVTEAFLCVLFCASVRCRVLSEKLYYDHDGIRVGQTLNGTDAVKYVVDKNRPYAQVLEEQWTRGTDTTTVSYVYGNDLLARTGNGMTHYYLYDGLGSTRALSDASGSVTDTSSYDAYGTLLSSSPGDNPYRYRGEQYDDALSAYYLRARYYQPGIGRFLTTDPVEGFPNKPISLHRYVYAEFQLLIRII